MIAKFIAYIKPLLENIQPYAERFITWMAGNMAEKDGTPSSMRLITVPLSYLLIITLVVTFLVASYHIGAIAVIPYETSLGITAILGVLLTGKIVQKMKE